jgi:hypothetical protein
MGCQQRLVACCVKLRLAALVWRDKEEMNVINRRGSCWKVRGGEWKVQRKNVEKQKKGRVLGRMKEAREVTCYWRSIDEDKVQKGRKIKAKKNANNKFEGRITWSEFSQQRLFACTAVWLETHRRTEERQCRHCVLSGLRLRACCGSEMLEPRYSARLRGSHDFWAGRRSQGTQMWLNM